MKELIMKELVFEELNSFREKLSKIYRERPYNDEGNPCDMSTTFEIMREYVKWKENLIVKLVEIDSH